MCMDVNEWIVFMLRWINDIDEILHSPATPPAVSCPSYRSRLITIPRGVQFKFWAGPSDVILQILIAKAETFNFSKTFWWWNMMSYNKKLFVKPSNIEFDPRHKMKGKGGSAKRHHIRRTVVEENRAKNLKSDLENREGRRWSLTIPLYTCLERNKWEENKDWVFENNKKRLTNWKGQCKKWKRVKIVFSSNWASLLRHSYF